MAYIVPGKLVYLCTPRTASMAVQSALQEIFPKGITTKEHHALYSGKEIQHHIKGSEIVICGVRDPLDIIASWWALNKEWQDKSMVDFINQYRHTYLQDYIHFHLPHATVLHRYEKLQCQFNILLSWLGKEQYLLKIINKTEGKMDNYFKLYGDLEIEAMWKRFPWDMALYYWKGIS